MPMSTGWPFVARATELATLLQLANEAEAGSGQVVLLAGEAGIGKSRLLDELLSSEELENSVRVTGHCREVEGAPVLWPWTQLFYQLTEKTQVGLQPALRGLLQSGQGSRLESDAKPEFELFEGLTQYLAECSTEKPILVAIEDIHWADSPSLRALEFVISGLSDSRIFLVLTLREPEKSSNALVRLLSELTRHSNAHRLDLQPFDIGAVQSLLSAKAPKAVSAAQELMKLTGGNPLFVTEVAALLEREQTYELKTTALPSAAISVIEDKFIRLPAVTVSALEASAVVGRNLDIELLSKISDQDPQSFLESIQPALDLGILEATGPMGTALRFSHEIVRQSVINGLPKVRSAKLNLATARGLEELHSTETAKYAGTIAHHYSSAQPLAGPEPVFEFSLMAGEYELANRAFAEASSHLEVALENIAPGSLAQLDDEINRPEQLLSARPLEKLPGTEQVASILALLSRAYAGENLDMLGLICQKASFDRFDELGLFEDAVSVAVYPRSVGSPASSELYSRAIKLAKPGTSEHVMLACKRGAEAAAVPILNPERSAELLAEAVAKARELGQPDVYCWALGRALMASDWWNAWDEAARYVDLVEPVLENVRDLEAAVHACFWGAMCRMTNGSLAGAERLVQIGWEIATVSKHGMRLAQAASIMTLLEIHRGHLSGAISFLEGLLYPRPGSPWLPIFRQFSALQIGETDATGDAEGLVNEDAYFHAQHAATLARIAVECEYNSVGWDRIAAQLERPHHFRSLPYHETSVQIGRAFASVALEDRVTAAESYAFIMPYAGRVPTQGWAIPVSTDRVLGRTATFLGDAIQAEKHFEDALALLRPNGYRLELAWTCYDYADALVQRGSIRDARFLISEGLKIAQDSSLVILERRLRELQKLTGDGASQSRLFTLTEREEEILRLIAAGKRNREIAESLFITGNTVSTHVKSILSKTSSATRTEAARKYTAAKTDLVNRGNS